MQKVYVLIAVIILNWLNAASLKAQCPAGPIILTSQSQIDNYTTDHPGCTTPNGIKIDGAGANPAISNINGLGSITTINGDLEINNVDLISLSAINNITGITGKLILQHNHLLTTTGLFNIDTLGGIVLLDLPALNNVAGITNNIVNTSRVDLDSVPLTDLTDFSNLVNIDGDLEISHSAVTTMSAMTNLRYLGGWIYLDDNQSLETIGINTITRCGLFIFLHLPSLTSIAGLTNSLTATGMGTVAITATGLTDLTGLDKITSLPNIYIDNNPYLQSLHGLEGLTGGLNYGISIHDNPLLTDISAFNGVTGISDGTLEISNNDALTSLAGLGNIQTIGNGLLIRNNEVLTSLESLHNALVIQNGNGDGVNIANNPQLGLCSFGPLCNYISNGGEAIIEFNAAGCDNVTEVLASCAVCTPDLKTWTGDEDNNWNNPGNWLPAGVPGNCSDVLIPEINGNYPVLESNVTIHGLTVEQNATIDIAGFTLNTVGLLNLQYASIEGGGSIVSRRAINPAIQNTYVDASLKLLDFSGQLEFNDNTFENDVEISDSTGRQAGASVNASTFFGNLTITNNSDYGNFYVSNSSPTTNHISGNLTVTNNSPSHINIGLGDPIYIQGNLEINTQFESIDLVHITFEGNNDSYITQGNGETVSMEDIEIAKSIGSSLILNQPLRITNTANFEQGIVRTGSGKEMIFDVNASWQGAHEFSYADGPVKKIGWEPFEFPVGAGNFFAPLRMTGLALAEDAFTVQYVNRDPRLDGYDTSLHVPGLSNISTKEYWNVTRSGGFGLPDIVLSYDRNRSGSLAQLIDLKIARWDGSQWQNEGGRDMVGDTTYATVTSTSPVISYGPFTLASPPTYKPIITIGTLSSTNICRGTSFTIPYTIDSSMVNGNIFRAELSDVNGSFASAITIGTLNSIQSGVISAFIPNNMIAGTSYRVRLIGTLPNDTSVNTITITISALPQQTFTITGTTQVCIGSQSYSSDAPESGVTYNWSLSGGGSLNSNGNSSTTVTWTTPGTYTLTLQTSTICGNGPQHSIQVTVNEPAPVSVPVITSSGRWIYSSLAPVTNPATTYQWYNNQSPIVGANTSSYYASAAGNYTVTYKSFCGESPVSNQVSFASASQPQTINFPAIAAQSYGTAPFVPSATASSGLQVFFTIISGPATINPQTNLMTITGVGQVTIIARQPGDAVYDTAAPVTRTFMVNPGTQVITFSSLPDVTYGSVPFSVNAVVNSGLPITYSIVSGPATIAGNTVSITGTGTVVVQASQPGDGNYNAAVPVNQSFCVGVPNNLDPIAGYTNLCPGSATYSVNAVPGASYFWRIAGGATLASTTSTVNINWSTPGLYKLLVSAAGSCGNPSVNDTLLVDVINSIQPDSVQAMFPANGAIDQVLPLTLSWIPARPNSFYTFDLYLWRSDLPQPSTPYAANLSSLNYTLPVNSGLTPGIPYKWMVVSHNGSCTTIQTGPVQQMTFAPLPDLVVEAVQAPVNAFSGQTISIGWTIKNAGPNRTNTSQNWTDAVFLSFDTMPKFSIPPATNPAAWSIVDFPVKALLIGTRPNVSALDSGQQYSNSLNFTLPVNYSQPLYAYVITNYQPTQNAPQQINYSNDTARASEPINVTLSPTPDLRVDTVFTPATTFSGSAINITYKVKNYGVLTPAGSSWDDKVYISQSPLFDINTAIPVKFEKSNGTYYPFAVDAVFNINTQMQPNDEYTKTGQIVIPNFIFGNYFVYVMTNATKSLYEGAAANNNINRSDIQVFLTPTPHLTISSLTLPLTTVSTTQLISANWTTYNAGFPDNLEKNKGHYIVSNGTCPEGISSRDSLGFGGSYWVDRLYLSTDPSVLNTASAILLNETKQGEPNSGMLQDNPLNTGCIPATINPASLNINTSNVIAQGSNHPKTTNIAIPDNLPAGNYYIYVLANAGKNVFEYPGNPETKRSSMITVQRPDVTVTATVSANSISGLPVTINYNVLNQGPGTVFNHVRKDQLYVSNVAVFNGSAQLIQTNEYIEDLPVNVSVQHSVNYTFSSSASGTRYFFVITNYDSSFRETSYTNNISPVVSTLLAPGTPADLTVSDFQVSNPVTTLSPSYFKYTVLNNGLGTTIGTWQDSLFVSCVSSFSPATAYFIGVRNHMEIVSPGSSYSDSFNITLPLSYLVNNCFPSLTNSTAYFHIKTNADQGVYEGGSVNNNVRASGVRSLINPLVDHVVTSVTGPNDGIAGRPYPVGWTVKNTGYNPGFTYYNAWLDGIYFSIDSIFNGNAVYAGSFNEGAVLGTNQTYTELKNGIVPNIPSGDYYVFVQSNISNSIPAEFILGNNINFIRDATGAAKKIHVTRPDLPDLVDTIISAPTLAATGQPITVIHKVTNSGTGETYPGNWSDDLWLSTDFIPGNGGDLRLSAKNHSGVLLPVQSYNDTLSATLALNITPGNYVLISRTNTTGNVFETSTNNNLSYSYITVFSPAPSDLVVENTSHPDTALLGYTMDTAKWTIKNNSSNTAAGISSDGIYLSRNTTLDSTAILLGIKNKTINMGALASEMWSLAPLVDNVAEGNYKLIVKTDVLNNIQESDKNNNTGVSLSTVYIKVKELPMNVSEVNTLQSVNRFYKLIIPDSLNGSTVRVTLKSADSLVMKNQLFIAKGYVPNAAQFDYSFDTPNYGNQNIVMASVTAGVYYIRIRCVSPNPVVQNITLKAIKLPFAILDVQSASGGNTGNVTVKISGSLFSNQMTAKLSNGGTTINASAVYFTNSTTVYATFNLQGKPLGVYDLTLTKPDATTAVLNNGFSIVNANNGGLITGGGINSGAGNGSEPGCEPGAASGLNSQLVIELVAPEKVFAGWPFTIQVNYTNPTNVDIPAQVRILYSERDIKMALTAAGVPDGSTSLYLELVEPGGPPGIIRAGASGTVIVYGKAPLSVPAHTHVLFKLQ